MTTSGLALPCSESEQELSPEVNTGYPNASDNKQKKVRPNQNGQINQGQQKKRKGSIQQNMMSSLLKK